MSTIRPGGAPFMNRLPQEAIDRFEGQQKTASRGLPRGWKDHIETFRPLAQEAGWDQPEEAHAACLDAAGEFAHHLRSRGEHGAEEVFYNHHTMPPKRPEAGGGSDRTLGEHLVVHAPTGHVIDWTARQFDPDADFPHVEPIETYGNRWQHPEGRGWRECAPCQADDHETHWVMNREREEHCPTCKSLPREKTAASWPPASHSEKPCKDCRGDHTYREHLQDQARANGALPPASQADPRPKTDGLVDLYHRTSREAADSIMSKGFGHPDGEDGGIAYFMRGDNGHGYGESRIHVRVPEHLIHEDEDQSSWDDGSEVDDDDKHWYVHNDDLKPEHIVGRQDD